MRKQVENNNKLYPLEKDVQKSCVVKLKKLGVSFIFKTHGEAYQIAGIPDLIMIHPENGRFVALEVKRPHVSKGPSKLQEKCMDRINAAGGFAEVVFSTMDAENALKKAGYGQPHKIDWDEVERKAKE